MDDNGPRRPRASEIRDGVLEAVLNAVAKMEDHPDVSKEKFDKRKHNAAVETDPIIWLENPETGDIMRLPGKIATPRKRKARSIGYFVRVARQHLHEMAVNPPPRSARTVLDYLLATCDWRNVVDVRQWQIAEATGLTQPTTARAMRWLVDATYLCKMPEKPGATPWVPGRSKRYWLNPEMFVFGDDEDNKALQEEIKALKAADDKERQAKMSNEEDDQLFSPYE